MSIEPWEEAIQQEENEEHEWMKTEHAADNPDQPKPTTAEQRTKCPSCGQVIPLQSELAKPTTEHLEIDAELAEGIAKRRHKKNSKNGLERQLAAAHAAIKHHNANCGDLCDHRIPQFDNAALNAAIAAAQKPLVDALERIASGTKDFTTSEIAESALAKVKEGK